ncbi:hypothetical protein PQR39_21110 [Paraburkholderia sediminicola]|uniref:terminase small subunit-like protein n=1 Tax=Paraburkholderia sediminicola TaxID=458836 RepID=UPI0038B8E2F9
MRELNRAAAGVKYYPKPTIDDLLKEFSKNRSIREVCADPKFPSMATVYRWLAEDPEFAADYAEAVRVASGNNAACTKSAISAFAVKTE